MIPAGWSNQQFAAIFLRSPCTWNKEVLGSTQLSLQFDHSNVHPAWKDPWLAEFSQNLNISILLMRTAGLNLLNTPLHT